MRRNFKRTAKRLTTALIIPPALWGAAYEWLTPPDLDTNDLSDKNVAAVVFTGDSDRLEEGLKLYAEHKVKWLLISGVNPKVACQGNKKRFILHFHYGGQIRDVSKIDIDYATDTHNNAAGTVTWLNTLNTHHHVGHVVLITSYPHMPRAVYMLQQAFKQAEIRIPILSYSVGEKLGLKSAWFFYEATVEEDVKLAVTLAGQDRKPWVQTVSSAWHKIGEKISDFTLSALHLFKPQNAQPRNAKPECRPANVRINVKLGSLGHKTPS